MTKAPDKRAELEQGKPILGTASQKQVERLLKKAAKQAAEDARRKWKKSGRNPFARHARNTVGAFEQSLRNALALHVSNSGPRPSIRMTAPDTGGRPFHFDHTAVSALTISLKPGETAPAISTNGRLGFAREKRHTSRSGAHMHYLEREGAAEQTQTDIEDAAGIKVEIEAAGRERTPGSMQEYLEDAAKEETTERTDSSKASAALVFSYGTIGEPRRSEPTEPPAPAFKRAGRIPQPAPGEVEAFPYDLLPLERIVPQSKPIPEPAVTAGEVLVPNADLTEMPPAKKKKKKQRARDRRRAILVRGFER